LWHLDNQGVCRRCGTRDAGSHDIVSRQNKHGDWCLAAEAYARAKGYDEG
jgi:hypothetical protein